MLVYHGAMTEIQHPDITFSRAKLDFGQGFYLAKDYEQARKWAERFVKRRCSGYVNVYELDMSTIMKDYATEEFENYNESWLQFVVANRKGLPVDSYDVISGGIANDRVFNTVELYLDGLITAGEALGRLKYERPNWQICIRNQEILDKYLRFVKCEVC